MYEVEVKVAADLDRVRARLAELGARSTGAVRQRDTYYDAPHRSFAETDEALRIRRVTDASDGSGSTTARADGDEAAATADRTVLTYKGPLVDSDSKSRLERETVVGDVAATDAILGELGFEPAAVVEKERERFRLDGYTVTLDSVADVGEYVEVETEADDVDEAREGVFGVVRDLGLDPGEQVRASYLALKLDGEGAVATGRDGADG
jgi:adenylate cyclase class 2